ncbi:MAG: energy transducer TonB [Acidobacteria bacterium]|nr:MAG: energy transducer TonB [Acidobacteriota bacterium]
MPYASQLRQPFHRDAKVLSLGAPRFDQLAEDARRDAEERRRARYVFGLAALIHALALALAIPSFEPPQTAPPRDQKVYVIQPVRLKPPAPQQQRAIPKKKAKKMPIPDPTPDDPEPILVEEIEVPVVDDLEPVDLVVNVPDAPPSAGAGAGPIGSVLQIGDGVSPPVKIHSPQPLYTEEARAARVQGMVILQAIIDAQGSVADVKLLKGLPHGLAESALDTVRRWKFKPATRDGQPVAVYFNLTVRFSLQ